MYWLGLKRLLKYCENTYFAIFGLFYQLVVNYSSCLDSQKQFITFLLLIKNTVPGKVFYRLNQNAKLEGFLPIKEHSGDFLDAAVTHTGITQATFLGV